MTDSDKALLLDLSKIVEYTATNPDNKDNATLAYCLECVVNDLQVVIASMYGESNNKRQERQRLAELYQVARDKAHSNGYDEALRELEAYLDGPVVGSLTGTLRAIDLARMYQELHRFKTEMAAIRKGL